MTRERPSDAPDWIAPRGADVTVAILSHRDGVTRATVSLYVPAITSRPWRLVTSWPTRNAHQDRAPAVRKAITDLCRTAGLDPPAQPFEPDFAQESAPSIRFRRAPNHPAPNHRHAETLENQRQESQDGAKPPPSRPVQKGRRRA